MELGEGRGVGGVLVLLQLQMKVSEISNVHYFSAGLNFSFSIWLYYLGFGNFLLSATENTELMLVFCFTYSF